jgi:hypothetical protein
MKRSGPPQRKTPMPRGTSVLARSALKPRKPFLRTGGLSRRAREERLAVHFAPGTKPAPARRAAQHRKDTIPPKVRRLVLERDGYCCVCCGRSIIGRRYSLGHRLRASQGGKPVPSNLLTFLGWGGQQCHGRIDNRADPRDEDNGLTVRMGSDPALIPVTIFTLDGDMTRWLDDLGNLLPDAPGDAA